VVVFAFFDSLFVAEKMCLFETLEMFRNKNGFGRAISAPQIGVPKRFIAMNLGEGEFMIINPKITNRSDETFTMWDDCMSFPNLMVKLRRNKNISIEYQDEQGEIVHWNNIDQAVSELLQHEIDHLDGILAVDRAYDDKSIINRSDYLNNIDDYSKQVDYVIKPTINEN